MFYVTKYAQNSHIRGNATLLLSYDAGSIASTVSDVAAYAIDIHTDYVHVFIFSVRTTWAQDADGDAGEEVGTDYRFIVSF